MGETKLHPEWKQALHEFLETAPRPGDFLSVVQFEAWCGMRRPTQGTEKTFQDYQLRLVRNFDCFQDRLMRRHQIQLAREGRGWRVLAAHEVAPLTRAQSDKEMLKSLTRQRARLAYTDLSELTPEQLREHAETTVRSSWKLRAIKDANKQPVALPDLPKPLPRRSR